MHRVGIFNVRVVRPGQKYGKADCLTLPQGDEALVEFYDATQDPTKFGQRGQLISRYKISTLYSARGGLDLCGEVPSWRLTELEVERVNNYLVGYFDGVAGL